jgi:hypothetical protein
MLLSALEADEEDTTETPTSAVVGEDGNAIRGTIPSIIERQT